MNNEKDFHPLNNGYILTKITKKNITDMLPMRKFSFKNRIDVYYNEETLNFLIVERTKISVKILYTLFFPIFIILSFIDFKNTFYYFKNDIWVDDLTNGKCYSDIVSPIKGDSNNKYWELCNEKMHKQK